MSTRSRRADWRTSTVVLICGGLVLTLPISIVLARFAAGNIRPIPLLLLCIVLVVANVGIFVVALRVQIPLWPSAL